MRPSSLSVEPPLRRGMTLQDFDRDAFRVELEVLGLKVPTGEVGRYRKQVTEHALVLPKVASVVQEPNDTQSRLLLLDKATIEELPRKLIDIIQADHLETRHHTVALGYDYWSATQILRAILPEELLDDLPTSFTIVGHIAHFNLRDEYLPYKHLIGQVILDKNPTITTVVNKLDSISEEYRFFAMEVLAGAKGDTVVEVSEHGCRFAFDFAKVYWNSRLQTEHTRLVELFELDDVVCDGFAGVGPFAVPAAKKGCRGVLASDLNPESARWLEENARLNRVDKYMRCDNMDGAEFFKKSVIETYENPFGKRPSISDKKKAALERKLREAAKKSTKQSGPVSDKSAINGNELEKSQDGRGAASVSDAQPEAKGLGKFIDHFVLNLPATAITFLSAFQGIYQPLLARGGFLPDLKAYSDARGWNNPTEPYRLPMVHCYCFTKEVEDYERDICERAANALGYSVSPDSLLDYSLSLVRSVAPKKDMYRLSFRLPSKVVFGQAASDLK